MFYKELYDDVLSGVNQWIPTVRLAAFQAMAYLAKAQSIFQTEAQLMTRIDSIVIPAGQSSANYSFRWEPKQLRVRDDVNKIDYGIRGYDQFMAAAAWLNPAPTQNARLDPVIQNPMNEPQGYICSFENRVLRVYPTPAVDLTLTVHYVPYLPLFTASDPYWSDWFGFNDTLASGISNSDVAATLTDTHSSGTLPADLIITDGTNTDYGIVSAVTGTGITFTRQGTLHAFSSGASVYVANRSQFTQMLNTMTPEREYFRFLDGFVEYAISQYLRGVVSNPGAKARMQLADSIWMSQLGLAKKLRGVKERFVQGAYSGPTSL